MGRQCVYSARAHVAVVLQRHRPYHRRRYLLAPRACGGDCIARLLSKLCRCLGEKASGPNGVQPHASIFIGGFALEQSERGG